MNSFFLLHEISYEKSPFCLSMKISKNNCEKNTFDSEDHHHILDDYNSDDDEDDQIERY